MTTRIVIYGLLAFFALVYLMPLFVMLVTSFKTDGRDPGRQHAGAAAGADLRAVGARPGARPASASTCAGIKGYFWNSIKMVVPAVLISTLLGALNGYVLTKWRFPRPQAGLRADAVRLLHPVPVGAPADGDDPRQLRPLRRSALQTRTGLTFGFGNPTVNLVFVHVVYGLGFTTLFFRNYYEAFPTELVKAAQIDGASFFQIFRRIMLPNSLPIFVVTVIYQFTNIWNDFLFASAYAGRATRCR